MKTNPPQTPSHALTRLKEGNQRFAQGVRSTEPLLSHLKLVELAENGQKPFAIVLTCSDSRSPAELIFDQGLGDLFVVRVAGNVVAPSLLASIEFAAANFDSALILVMGHTQCGAVTAAFHQTLDPSRRFPSTHLKELVSLIQPAVDKIKELEKGDPRTMINHAVIENVKQSMELIYQKSAIVRNLVDQKKIGIEGAVLDIHTGKVNFISGD